MAQPSSQVEIDKEAEVMYIFRASKKTKDGTVIYARDYGKRAFPIWIGPGSEPLQIKRANA